MKKLALVAAFALAGCSSTKVFHSAFEDITQETRATVGDFSTYRQLITLNGLMPMHVPGMLFYEPAAGWFRNDSTGLLVGISPKRSMVVEARYDATDPETAVAEAQQSYQSLRSKAVSAVAARLRVAMLDLNLSKNPPDADDIARKREEAIVESDRLRKELEAEQAAFSRLGHNIMVARWTKKEEFKGVAKLADLVGMGSGRQFEESGVLILAGIRVLNAYFGEDLFCMARHARGSAAQWDHMKRISIAVNMIQARAVGYVSDLDVGHTLALSLDVSKEQLDQLLKDGLLAGAGEGAKIRAEALVASAMGISNFGRMVKPTVDQRKTRFYPAARQVEELEEELEGRDKYVTVSVTRVQFTEKMLHGLANAATDTICNEELEPGRSLTETVAKTRRRIEISASAAANILGLGKAELPQAALIRRTLNGKLASARAAADACRARIAEIDQDVTDALAAEMMATDVDRESRRYKVRIRKLERDQDAARLMAFLNAISDQVYEAHKGLRVAEALQREGRDPSPQVRRVALALGVKDEEAKLAAAGAVLSRSTSAPKGEPLTGARSAPAVHAKDALVAAQAAAAPDDDPAALCRESRPSRL